ncbi:hypothetical protein [Schlesneria sp.]|uniref:hypothetical protein n=1 Tax=Schlesneria sp. TaxID=2762018 RepID=UPI002F14CBFE
MDRFVAAFFVLSFLSQQFACCGVGICATVCGSETQASQQAKPAGQVAKKTACPCPHHGNTSREKSGSPAPQPVPHQHHVCVGTHLFYVTADRFDLAELASQTVLLSGPLCSSLNFLTSHCMLAVTALTQGDSPQALGPERSVLCIYRI